MGAQKRGVGVSIATMGGAAREELGLTLAKRRWIPSGGTKKRGVLGGGA